MTVFVSREECEDCGRGGQFTKTAKWFLYQENMFSVDIKCDGRYFSLVSP